MRPLNMNMNISGSSSLKSNFEEKAIEEEDEDELEGLGNLDVPIFAIEDLPKTNVVTNILQNNECIRGRSHSENFSKISIFSFCSTVRDKRNSVIS